MVKLQYLTAGNIVQWTDQVIEGLENSRARTKLPVLDSSAALLLLDPQKIFVSESSPAFLPSWTAVKANCLSLLRHALENNRLVIITRHVHPPEDAGGSIFHFFGRLIREADPLSELDDDIPDTGKARVITKARHSAFSSRRLKEMLLEHNIAAVIIAGVQAHLCVLATAVEAGTNDFIPVIAVDATAAGTERQHRAALEALSDGIASVMTTKEIIERWY